MGSKAVRSEAASAECAEETLEVVVFCPAEESAEESGRTETMLGFNKDSS